MHNDELQANMLDGRKLVTRRGAIQAPTALLVSRNPLVARKAAQVLQCGGLVARTAASVNELAELDYAPNVVCLPSEDLSTGLRILNGYRDLRAFVSVEEPDPSVFAAAMQDPRICGVFGLRYPGAAPRPWELIAIARRLSAHELPHPQAALTWGHTWHESQLATQSDRERMVENVGEFCAGWQSTRQASNIAQLADELIMNAMYDAPIDEHGRPKYAHRRKEPVQLAPHERPTFGYGSDGTRIVIAIADPFGRLTRESVFGGLHRSLTTGRMDTSGGGAGLGMMLIHQAAKVVFFDVIAGAKTQVTAVLELDVPPRQMRKLPGSVHFFEH